MDKQFADTMPDPWLAPPGTRSELLQRLRTKRSKLIMSIEAAVWAQRSTDTLLSELEENRAATRALTAAQRAAAAAQPEGLFD